MWVWRGFCRESKYNNRHDYDFWWGCFVCFSVLRSALQWLGVAFLLVGAAHSPTPAAHLIISVILNTLLFSLLTANVLRLPDVVHGFFDCAISCEPSLLCHLTSPVIELAPSSSVFATLPRLCNLPTLHCGSSVLHFPEPPPTLLHI